MPLVLLVSNLAHTFCPRGPGGPSGPGNPGKPGWPSKPGNPLSPCNWTRVNVICDEVIHEFSSTGMAEIQKDQKTI